MSDLPASADPRRLRVADSDRDHAADMLRQAAAEGRLTMEELEDRISLAYAARTYADLEGLTRDLPGPGVSPPVRAGGPAGQAPVPVTGDGAKVSVAILSGTKRAGPWEVPPAYTAVAILGGVELDLRDARFSAPEVTIQAFCFMGGVTVTVPEDVAVDVSGLGVMGGFGHDASGPGASGAPRVRVVGLALMGGVEVKRAPSGQAARN